MKEQCQMVFNSCLTSNHWTRIEMIDFKLVNLIIIWNMIIINTMKAKFYPKAIIFKQIIE